MAVFNAFLFASLTAPHILDTPTTHHPPQNSELRRNLTVNLQPSLDSVDGSKNDHGTWRLEPGAVLDAAGRGRFRRQSSFPVDRTGAPVVLGATLRAEIWMVREVMWARREAWLTHALTHDSRSNIWGAFMVVFMGCI
jgi:hypothetical protein